MVDRSTARGWGRASFLWQAPSAAWSGRPCQQGTEPLDGATLLAAGPCGSEVSGYPGARHFRPHLPLNLPLAHGRRRIFVRSFEPSDLRLQSCKCLLLCRREHHRAVAARHAARALALCALGRLAANQARQLAADPAHLPRHLWTDLLDRLAHLVHVARRRRVLIPHLLCARLVVAAAVLAHKHAQPVLAEVGVRAMKHGRDLLRSARRHIRLSRQPQV
mmetsp:Transcript_14338/g.46570  ORF Transcript_14338/g.46570 Transcript_14338/m.46570 type:complete len:219 (+) Transcript_14338:577-1233(+)